MTGGDLQLER